MKLNKFSIVFIFLIFFVSLQVAASNNFYAYYTKVQNSSTDFFGKYADIIVVIGKDKQLDFTRNTGYIPLWKTPAGEYLIDDLYPGRDKDYEFDYNYVRLIENNDDKIVVEWRYFPYIKTMEQANRDLDPLTKDGILGVVYELFTIYPDGTLERSVKEAKNTLSHQWINPQYVTKQTIKLLENGIDHGHVFWGRISNELLTKNVESRPVISNESLPKPLLSWKFDEILDEFEGFVVEDNFELETPIEGMMTDYKKGVSGTALAFDGYYTGLTVDENVPKFDNALSVSAWLALDVYPYNEAPIISQSKGFGKEGYYLGLDPYGHLFFRINGSTVRSDTKLSLYKWHHVAATVNKSQLKLYVDGNLIAVESFSGNMVMPDTPLKIGINSEKERCTDFVRTNEQNLLFILGIQGVLDELDFYLSDLTDNEIKSIYNTYKPDDLTSPIRKAELPGEVGRSDNFGAYYTKLNFSELWDDMFRVTDYADIVVKFRGLPTSVVYWRGTNYAANWITEENQWMSDQSSEIFTAHGCSEHMADKQIRHCYASIIENTPARVVIHWRYPCVDVSYLCTDRRNWTDEYHTIYPDGTGVRKVIWNKGYDTPGFEDIQFFTNPGQSPLDVVDLQAMTVANIKGDVEKLKWALPNHVPKITIEDATIELLNSKSKYKIFTIFQGGEITPWGIHEQSKYTDDPFAGPWNHWPTHLVPSDGRFAVDYDRVTHFALGANDATPEFGSIVQYGFTNQPIDSVIEYAKFWQKPPEIKDLTGGEGLGFNKDQKSFEFILKSKSISFNVDASSSSPIINPAFVIYNWGDLKDAIVEVDGKKMIPGDNCQAGLTHDTKGKPFQIVWMELKSEKPIMVKISK